MNLRTTKQAREIMGISSNLRTSAWIIIFFGSHVAWGALGYEPNLRSHYLFCSAQLVKTSWVRLAIIKHISTLHIRYRFLHKDYAVYLGLGNLKCLKTDVNARYLICHRLKILLWICLACVSHATRMTLYLQLCTLFLGRSWGCGYKDCHSTVVMYLCVAEAEDGRGVKCLLCRTQENRMVVSKCSRHIIPRQFLWGWLGT